MTHSFNWHKRKTALPVSSAVSCYSRQTTRMKPDFYLPDSRLGFQLAANRTRQTHQARAQQHQAARFRNRVVADKFLRQAALSPALRARDRGVEHEAVVGAAWRSASQSQILGSDGARTQTQVSRLRGRVRGKQAPDRPLSGACADGSVQDALEDQSRGAIIERLGRSEQTAAIQLREGRDRGIPAFADADLVVVTVADQIGYAGAAVNVELIRINRVRAGARSSTEVVHVNRGICERGTGAHQREYENRKDELKTT